MLTINKLEKIIELEESLRAEYQGKIDSATSETAHAKKELAYTLEKVATLQGTIKQQLETIQELSSKAAANQKIERRNQELHNRSDNLTAEITTLKQRIKDLQKDLASEREQIKELTKFDPIRMKKNLDAGKKKLAEKTQAADLLQKSLKEVRNDKAELERELKEMTAKLSEIEAVADTTAEEADADGGVNADEKAA